jgi:hypothetical protein
MEISKKKIVIIIPGSSYFTLHQTYNNLKNKYNVITVGHSCLGTGYDRYPSLWKKGTDDINLVSMVTDTEMINPITQNIELGIELCIKNELEKGPIDCIVCGSRGGQVVLPTLWKLGIDIPCVITNAGCIDSPCFHAYPISRVVFSTFGKDYFHTKNPQISINALQKCAKSSILVHSYFEQHLPNDEYYKNILPLMIEAAINGNITKLNNNFINNNLGFIIQK